MKTANGMARLGTALVLGLLLGGCEGNVNDDDVPVLPIDVVSYNTSGSFAKGSCYDPSVSRDGRYVAFFTYASLHPLDNNSNEDVYVRDLVEGRTTLVSINAQRTNGGNSYSENARIDPDGRFVAFCSVASNLINVAGFTDENYMPDIYVHDLLTGVTMPVTVNNSETGMIGVDWGEFPDLVQFDADNDGSPDELYVVFSSRENVLGDSPNISQIYVRKMQISYFTDPLNLTKIQNGTTYRISKDYTPGGNEWGDGASESPVIAKNNVDPAYLTVAWQSYATNLVNVITDGTCNIFLRVFQRSDPNFGGTVLISRASGSTQGGNGHSTAPVISEDGGYVAFVSEATNLLPTVDSNGQPDVFRVGPLNGPWATTLVSEGNRGMANNRSMTAGISVDGRYVLFSSDASNLVEGDTNDYTDVFLKDMELGTLGRVSLTVFGEEPSGQSGYSYAPGGADLSGDGRTVVFQSRANNILPGITFFEGQQIYRRKY